MNKKQLIKYLKNFDGLFPTQVSTKCNLNEFADKLLSKATLCAEIRDGEIIGLLIGYTDQLTDNMAFISTLAVLENVQRQGLASKLMHDFIKICQEKNIEKIHLYLAPNNIEAITFYRKEGFTDYPIEKENRPNDLHLVKRIRGWEQMFTSPIEKMRKMYGSANIYVKREDLLPFSFGGNKVRIAQEYYLDMVEKGKDCMIGYGNARSNLCRVLANMNYARGRRCHIISPSEDDGTRIETSNSLIAKSCGATFHKCNKRRIAESVRTVIEECEKEGFNPYYMYGDEYGNGNESVPVRAYAKVYDEILYQSNKMGIHFETIFLATGTGMTQAGLIAGRELNHGKEKIIGISVARSVEKEKPVLFKFIERYLQSINANDKFSGAIDVVDKFLCGGYGLYNDEITTTIGEILLQEGIALDPIYTGKAFYGMLKTIQEEDIKGNVLFIHTGGTPLFFDNINFLKK